MDRRCFLQLAFKSVVLASGQVLFPQFSSGAILTEPTDGEGLSNRADWWDEWLLKTRDLPYEGSGSLSGDVDNDIGYLKVKRLDISPGSRLTFHFDRPPGVFVIAAEEVYIQRAPNQASVASIGYVINQSYFAHPPIPQAPGGVNGVHKTGQNGGDGQTGQRGADAIFAQAPCPLFIFRKLTVHGAANPSASTLLNFEFSGPNSSNGQDGGKGGNGGHGGQGTPAENNRVPYPIGDGEYEDGTCHKGPGNGGDSGRPGAGGQGGDGTIGGPGGNVVVMCPQSEKPKIAFAAITSAGKPGLPGRGGEPGAKGVPGGGGDLSSYCRGGGNSGKELSISPTSLGPGSPTQFKASDGQYGIIHRDTSIAFNP